LTRTSSRTNCIIGKVPATYLFNFAGQLRTRVKQVAAFFEVSAVEEEFLAVGGYAVGSIISLDSYGLKQAVRNAEVDDVSGSEPMQSGDGSGRKSRELRAPFAVSVQDWKRDEPVEL
jgi:hypothetical protein